VFAYYRCNVFLLVGAPQPTFFFSPFGGLSRDHRKTLCVDGEIGFVSGLCVGRIVASTPTTGLE